MALNNLQEHGLSALERLWLSSESSCHTMFYKHSERGKIAILIVYVDYIIPIGDDLKELSSLKKTMTEYFEIKDLGSLKYFLSTKFARSREGIFVNQRKYILDLLAEIGLLGCKATETRIEANLKLNPTIPEDVIERENFSD